MDGKQAVDEVVNWCVSAATLRTTRPWCLFGLTGPVTGEKLRELFDRSDLEKKYADRVNEKDPQKKRQHSYVQTEISLVYGIHKAMAARHRSRLQLYRDDASQKAYHTRRAVQAGQTKLQTAIEKAEQ